MINIYSKILTTDDWEDFKSKFEQEFPNIIYNLRTHFRDMTPAEERLFLLIKSKLKSNEIANILGISPVSIKKSRQRLRKRLNLPSSADLESYIDAFQ